MIDVRTCALEGCENTWTYDGTVRKYCSKKHKTYAANHKPTAVARRLAANAEWARANPAMVNEKSRRWRRENYEKRLTWEREWRAKRRQAKDSK